MQFLKQHVVSTCMAIPRICKCTTKSAAVVAARRHGKAPCQGGQGLDVCSRLVPALRPGFLDSGGGSRPKGVR